MKNGINEIEDGKETYNFELNKLEKVQSKNEYYNAKKCVELFYDYVSDGNREKIYGLLDDEYVQMANITKEQLKINNISKVKIDINKMYTIKISNDVDVYLIYGKLIDTNSNKMFNLAVGVKMNPANSTFSILPYEYMTEKNMLKIDENSEINFNRTEKIENKTYNVFKSIYLNDEEYVKYIFETFTERMSFNIEQAYQDLDQNYKEKRFGSLQNFTQYVSKNKELYL